MSTLWCLGEEVPHHVGALTVILGVPLLSVDEIRELYGVSDEEHRCVVSCHVPITLLGVELHSKSSGVPLRIS